MKLYSDAFKDGQPIPRKYTCDGADISPPLQWGEVPDGARSFALICDDPDAPSGTWVHWVLYNLPSNMRELPEDLDKREALPNGARQGLTDFQRTGYGGPCPPPGDPHHYYFKLYALNEEIAAGPNPTKRDLLEMMEGHVLEMTSLMGMYRRHQDIV